MTADPAGMTPDQIAEASASELAAGRLPLQAQWRIADQRRRRDAGEPGAFTSNLTTEEFAAVRSVGFTPVGQVMGSAVYNVGWWPRECGGFSISGFGMALQQAPTIDAPNVRDLMERARHTAIERMRAECAGLGGDGVVGVRLTARGFYGNGLEFIAMGTAVRADGEARPRQPFTSDLSGQAFAKLLRARWIPVDLVLGVGAALRHDDFSQTMQLRSGQNQELVGLTGLVHSARAAARASLDRDASARGGHTVVLRNMLMSVFERRCQFGEDNHDHCAEAFLWGTAITPIDADADAARPASGGPSPLSMLRLEQGRRGGLKAT